MRFANSFVRGAWPIRYGALPASTVNSLSSAWMSARPLWRSTWRKDDGRRRRARGPLFTITPTPSRRSTCSWCRRSRLGFCMDLILRQSRRKLLWLGVTAHPNADLRHVLASYQKYYNEVRTPLSLQKDAPFRRDVCPTVRRRSWAVYTTNMFEFEFPTGTTPQHIQPGRASLAQLRPPVRCGGRSYRRYAEELVAAPAGVPLARSMRSTQTSSLARTPAGLVACLTGECHSQCE
jgi:hypothetical protein